MVDELEEISEIIFVSKGSVVVGYDINKQKRYCLKFLEKFVVGAYELSFNQRSQVIYTSLTQIHGYSIRRSNWHIIMNEDPLIVNAFKNQIKERYFNDVHRKVLKRRRLAIQEMKQRSDYQMIQVSENKEFGLQQQSPQKSSRVPQSGLISEYETYEEGEDEAMEQTEQAAYLVDQLDDHERMVTELLRLVELREQMILKMEQEQKEADDKLAEMKKLIISEGHIPEV